MSMDLPIRPLPRAQAFLAAHPDLYGARDGDSHPAVDPLTGDLLTGIADIARFLQRARPSGLVGVIAARANQKQKISGRRAGDMTTPTPRRDPERLSPAAWGSTSI